MKENVNDFNFNFNNVNKIELIQGYDDSNSESESESNPKNNTNSNFSSKTNSINNSKEREYRIMTRNTLYEIISEFNRNRSNTEKNKPKEYILEGKETNENLIFNLPNYEKFEGMVYHKKDFSMIKSESKRKLLFEKELKSVIDELYEAKPPISLIYNESNLIINQEEETKNEKFYNVLETNKSINTPSLKKFRRILLKKIQLGRLTLKTDFYELIEELYLEDFESDNNEFRVREENSNKRILESLSDKVKIMIFNDLKLNIKKTIDSCK